MASLPLITASESVAVTPAAGMMAALLGGVVWCVSVGVSLFILRAKSA